MSKKAGDFENLAKPFGGIDPVPDTKGEKVSRTKASKVRNNKPIPNK